MNFLRKIFGNKKNSEIFSNEEIIEAGACPNCWGIIKYDGEFNDYVYDQTKSNINKDKGKKKAFIQQFVENNLTGIRLKQSGKQQQCPECRTNFKYVSSKS